MPRGRPRRQAGRPPPRSESVGSAADSGMGIDFPRMSPAQGPTDAEGGHASPGLVSREASDLPIAFSPLIDREVMSRRGSTHRGVTGRQRRRETGTLAPSGVSSAGGFARADF